ncbi:hypothetical protein SESBI_25036 [Sesbania bispinosa]|nr:hypothetical protein SESBI_25036 [Sesbania bispinosa]
MKFRVVLSLLLGCLFMTVQGDSSTTLVSADKEGNKIKHEEPFERSGAAHHMRKVGVGGRKFMIHHDEEEITRRRSVDSSKNGRGITSKISGATYSDGICDFEREGSDDKIVKCKEIEIDGLKKSFGSLQEQKDHYQKHMIMGSKAYLKFTKFVIPRKSGPTNTKAVEGGAAEKHEAQNHVEAANKIANLIYMDYKGRPSHKPPINNHEPRD